MKNNTAGGGIVARLFFRLLPIQILIVAMGSVNSIVPGGNTICLPYLAAIIRLADEIDVAAARNAKLLYDIESITDEIEKYYHSLVRDCKRLDITDTTFCMVVYTEEPEIKGAMEMLRDKIQDTLDLCRSVVNHRTAFDITQKNVEIEWI